MANYNKILEIDNQNLQMRELKAAIKNNRDKSMHVRYMAIYHYLQGKSNVDIAGVLGICAHTVGVYIRKYETNGLSSLIPAPKSGAPRLLTQEQEEELKKVITSNTPDKAGLLNRKNWDAHLNAVG